MWNAWTAPPGALPRDYDPWSCEAHCARCGELAQDCHCDEDDDMSNTQDARRKALIEEWRALASRALSDDRANTYEECANDLEALSRADDDSSNEDNDDPDHRTR
jgi:hypothetical protein